MNNRKQWILIICIILFFDFFSIVHFSLSNMSHSPENNPLTVSQLYRQSLLGEEVYVKGKILKILPDYKSKKGYMYQQFIISDGKENIKIFCSQKYGRANISEGEEIVFNGKFQKYYNDFEVYGFCSEIKSYSYP